MNDDFEKKIIDIETRAKSIKEKMLKDNISDHQHTATPEQIKAQAKNSRAGSEFLLNVFAGGLIGYGVDYTFSTLPWGIIFFMIMGFVSGVYRANAEMKKNSK